MYFFSFSFYCLFFQKFNLTVTVHPDSVSIEETVKEDSDEIYTDEDAQNLVISIQEDAEDERYQKNVLISVLMSI